MPTNLTIQTLLGDVVGSTGHRYAVTDNAGNTTDTVKIITNRAGGYLGVYHTGSKVNLASSTDLVNWVFRRTLDPQATQPTMCALSTGGFLTATEFTTWPGPVARSGSGTTRTCRRCWPARSTVSGRSPDRCRGSEGTPSIYSVSLTPDIDHSIIDVGFHYQRNCDVDRQARGRLINLTTWTAASRPRRGRPAHRGRGRPGPGRQREHRRPGHRGVRQHPVHPARGAEHGADLSQRPPRAGTTSVGRPGCAIGGHAVLRHWDRIVAKVRSRGREDQMALSEYEQRKLDEIERSLHSDDPALATILDSGVVRRHRRSVAAVIFVGGLVALLGGVVTALSVPALGVVISVVGFAAMGVGAGLLMSRRPPGRPSAEGGRGAGSAASSPWRTRMAERFQARFDDPGK